MNRIDTWRNRLAWRICNWVLAHIADDYYSSYIGVAICRHCGTSDDGRRM